MKRSSPRSTPTASPRPHTSATAGRPESAANPTIPDRVWVVPAELDGALLDRVVRALVDGSSWGDVRRWVRGGHVLVDGVVTTSVEYPVPAGREVRVAPRPSAYKTSTDRQDGDAASRATSPSADSTILYADSQLVVVNKPAGVSTVPYDESEKDTLDRRVARALVRHGHRPKLLTVHRLDKETSGVLVFARTHQALERLKSQFRFKTTERRYEAIAHGSVESRHIESRLVKDRGDGLRGSTDSPHLGRVSSTTVTRLGALRGATHIACRLGSGRTHQIRIHLSEAGHPLVGERVYSRGYAGPLIEAPRVMLHAIELGFDHPSDGRRMSYSSPLPPDFRAMLETLGRR